MVSVSSLKVVGSYSYVCLCGVIVGKRNYTTCNELDRMAFCIWRIIDSHLSPTSSLFNIFLNLFRTAPKDIHDDVILIDLILRISVREF